MTKPGIRSWLGTAFLLLAILVLGVLVAREQHRETRLRAALARFQRQAHRDIHNSLCYLTLDPKDSPLASVTWGQNSTLESVIDQITAFAKRASVGGTRRAVSVEVDAIGIEADGQSINSIATLPTAPTREIAVRDVLLQLLQPFDLAYQVRDGCLTITTQKRVNHINASILKQLDQRITLTWTKDDSLEAVIERVRLRSGGQIFPEGLPFSVQLHGLTAPYERLVSANYDREELSIREQLSRLLEPLGLEYEVKDGALLIVPESSAP
jgi:hypothetical protein